MKFAISILFYVFSAMMGDDLHALILYCSNSVSIYPFQLLKTDTKK